MGKRKEKVPTETEIALRNAESSATLLRLCLRDLVNGTQPFAFETVSVDGMVYILRLFGHDEFSGGRLLINFSFNNEPNHRLHVDAHYLDSYQPPTDHALYAAWRNLVSKRDAYFNSPEFLSRKGA